MIFTARPNFGAGRSDFTQQTILSSSFPSSPDREPDFFSRLALTFQKGDYAGIDAIAHKDRIVEKLYLRSLEYGTNARAYGGQGMLYQQRKDFDEAIQISTAGIRVFPRDEQLNLCLAVSYMNLGNYQKALSCLSKLQHKKKASTLLPNVARRWMMCKGLSCTAKNAMSLIQKPGLNCLF